jgi:hypothetical protein
MEKDTTASIEDLMVLARKSFHVLQPNIQRKGKFNYSLQIDGYAELHFLIRDMTRVCIAALDAEQEGVTNIKNTHSAVVSVLELVLQLVPREEMELLDKLHGMVVEG